MVPSSTHRLPLTRISFYTLVHVPHPDRSRPHVLPVRLAPTAAVERDERSRHGAVRRNPDADHRTRGEPDHPATDSRCSIPRPLPLDSSSGYTHLDLPSLRQPVLCRGAGSAGTRHSSHRLGILLRGARDDERRRMTNTLLLSFACSARASSVWAAAWSDLADTVTTRRSYQRRSGFRGPDRRAG